MFGLQPIDRSRDATERASDCLCSHSDAVACSAGLCHRVLPIEMDCECVEQMEHSASAASSDMSRTSPPASTSVTAAARGIAQRLPGDLALHPYTGQNGSRS